ncbi:MAG: T9SS type A sorting domain-containing protein [Candidatus Marinimicrobia bacterium]|nr:T9SS type A sorting domain-containing protein [Candidatus Neomarinimicrobiota bacterium]
MTPRISRLLALLLALWGPTPIFPQIVPTFPVDPGSADDQRRPDIAVDADGSFTVVWGAAVYGDVYLAVYDALGNTLREPRSIDSSNGLVGYLAAPKIKTLGDYTVVVWQASYHDPGSESNVGGRLFTRAGDPVGGGIFQSFDQLGDFRPQVSYINDSTFYLVWGSWHDGTPSEADIYGQIMTNSRRRIGDSFIVNDHTDPEVGHYGHRIAASPSANRGVIVWYDNRTGQRQVYGRRFGQNGLPQDSSFLVSDLSGHSDVSFLATEMDTRGNFLVTWAGQVDSVFSIFLRRYDSNGAALGQITKVNDGENLGIIYSWVDVSIDLDGIFIVVWEELIDGVYASMGQRFAANGAKMGPNFYLNPPDTVPQFWPAVSLRNRKIYLAWERQGTLTQPDEVWVAVLDFDDPLTVSDMDGTVPTDFQFHPNYPNPFNSTTVLSFDLTTSLPAGNLTIYNILGRPVKAFGLRSLAPGHHTLNWDGNDEQGQPAPSGIYIYRLVATSIETGERFTANQKMVLLK